MKTKAETAQSASEVSVLTNADTLLTYRFSTAPSPIQVSAGHVTTQGRINLSVAAASTAAYCNKIQIAVPIGDEASDLSAATPANSVNTAKWSMTLAEIIDGSDIGLQAGKSYARYTFQTRAPADNKIDYDFVIGLVADVNRATGTFDYLIQETSGSTNDPASFTPKKAVFELDKTTPQFYLNNFVATTTAAPTVPATEFANSAPIRLAWESNGTFFEIFEKNTAAPVYSGSASTFTLAGGAKTDTTYILVASVTTGSAGSGGGGYEPIFLYESLTITISNPDLTPSSVAVSGNQTVGGTLGVTGKSSLQDTAISTLAVSGNETIAGTLGVTGKTTLHDTAMASATVSGNQTVGGTLHASGAVTSGSLSTGGASVSSLSTGYINGAGGATINGYVNLCTAPDYSKGNVGIGGKNTNNVNLQITNTQTTGYGIYINAPKLGGGNHWWALSVHGYCINTTGSWYKLSDAALKDRVRSYDDGLAQILDMNPVRYHFKEETGLGSEGEHVGLMAQDLEAIAPYLVGKTYLSPESEEEVKTINPGPLTYMLINAIKELKAEIDALKAGR